MKQLTNLHVKEGGNPIIPKGLDLSSSDYVEVIEGSLAKGIHNWINAIGKSSFLYDQMVRIFGTDVTPNLYAQIVKSTQNNCSDKRGMYFSETNGTSDVILTVVQPDYGLTSIEKFNPQGAVFTPVQHEHARTHNISQEEVIVRIPETLNNECYKVKITMAGSIVQSKPVGNFCVNNKTCDVYELNADFLNQLTPCARVLASAYKIKLCGGIKAKVGHAVLTLKDVELKGFKQREIKEGNGLKFPADKDGTSSNETDESTKLFSSISKILQEALFRPISAKLLTEDKYRAKTWRYRRVALFVFFMAVGIALDVLANIYKLSFVAGLYNIPVWIIGAASLPMMSIAYALYEYKRYYKDQDWVFKPGEFAVTQEELQQYAEKSNIVVPSNEDSEEVENFVDALEQQVGEIKDQK